MIDGSEKRNRQLAFEFHNSRVFEKRSKHRQNQQGCSWCVQSLFFAFYAAFEHSLQFREF